MSVSSQYHHIKKYLVPQLLWQRYRLGQRHENKNVLKILLKVRVILNLFTRRHLIRDLMHPHP